jgi:predicted ester cyclase
VGNSGLAPTGRAMRVRGTSITEFKNDRIIRNTDYWNMARMMRQLDGSESI